LRKTRSILLIAIALLTAATGLAAQQQGVTANLNLYELYSWIDTDGEWRFSLQPATGEGNLSSDQVFDPKITLKGVKDLKKKIAALPQGSSISWANQLEPGNGTKPKGIIAYPPEKMKRDIQGYAWRHNVGVTTKEEPDLAIFPEDSPKH